ARGQRVAQNLGELHGDTIEQARVGNALGKQFSLTEKTAAVNGVGDTPNQHDILTGTQPDGRAYSDGDHTCNNWTSNGQGTAQLGHSDKQGGGNSSWNSAHPSRGCSQPNLVSTGGAGRSEEHTSELQSLAYLVCRLLLEKKKQPQRLELPAQQQPVLHPVHPYHPKPARKDPHLTEESPALLVPAHGVLLLAHDAYYTHHP